MHTLEMYTTGILFVPYVDSVPYFACNYSTLFLLFFQASLKVTSVSFTFLFLPVSGSSC